MMSQSLNLGAAIIKTLYQLQSQEPVTQINIKHWRRGGWRVQTGVDQCVLMCLEMKMSVTRKFPFPSDSLLLSLLSN